LGKGRAIAPKEDLNRQPFHRARRSIGSRYLLKTDIARFYPSIYTHSIPWALHGKDAARKDKEYKLLGNRLDLWMRETQDKQTGGIPIGPDTSFVVGEVIASAIDLRLKERIAPLGPISNSGQIKNGRTPSFGAIMIGAAEPTCRRLGESVLSANHLNVPIDRHNTLSAENAESAANPG
jgi:hypothetical protein